MNNERLPFTINLEIEQGEILVNEGYEEVCDLKLLKIDLRSKYAECAACNGEVPKVLLFASTVEYAPTLYTDENNKDNLTVVTLKDYQGWEVLDCYVGRYTLTVILKKIKD